jgi:DNA-binding CsgD family transcriptional regulator
MHMVARPPPITDEDLNNIPKVTNGHSRKIINRSIMSRRHTLHTLMAKGLNQYQAAAILGCSQETVCNDVAWLRNYYRQQMHHYIENRLPEMWESCLTQLHSTMAAVAKIAEDPNTPTHDKLHAHSLMVDCIKVKEGLISDPIIIQEALDIVDQTKKRIVEISQEKSKELLHMEEEGKEVQPTKQQHQQEESEEHQKEQEDQKTNNSIF